MSDRCEKRTFLRQCSRIRNNRKCVHLQAVVIMKAKRFMLYHTSIKLKSTLLQSLAAARMTRIKYRHIVFLCHCINCSKQRFEILFRVDILLTMSRKKDIFTLLQAKTRMYVRCFYFCQILMKHLCHRRSSNVSTLFCHTRSIQIATGMLAVAHIHIGNNVDYPPVGFFRKALIKASIACLHVKYRNVQTLCRYHRQTRIGVAKHKHRIWLNLRQQLIRAIDYVADSCAQIIAYRIHIDLGVLQFQVVEKHTIKIVVIVLSCMGKYTIKIFTAFVDYCCQTDDFRSRAHDDDQLQSTVVGKMYVTIIEFHCFYTFSKYVSGFSGLNRSFAHINVTKSSVSDRLMILCV